VVSSLDIIYNYDLKIYMDADSALDSMSAVCLLMVIFKMADSLFNAIEIVHFLCLFLRHDSWGGKLVCFLGFSVMVFW